MMYAFQIGPYLCWIPPLITVILFIVLRRKKLLGVTQKLFFHHGGGPDLHNYILRFGHLFKDLSDALRFSGIPYMPGSCLFVPSPSDMSRNLGLAKVSDVIV